MNRRRYRIGTFNLKNLQDPETVFYQRKKYTLEQYKKKVAWSAAQMDRLRADIIGCQEVFSKKALRDILKKTEGYSVNDLYMAPSSDPQKPDCALVSKLPVQNIEMIEDFPASVNAVIPTRTGVRQLTKFSRPILKATIDLKGRNIVVYVVHFKSQRPMVPSTEDEIFKDHAIGTMKSSMVRLYEATALRHLIQDDLMKKPHQPLLVLGDFNDDHQTPSRDIILGPEPWALWKESYQRAYYDYRLYSSQAAHLRTVGSQPETTYSFNMKDYSLDDVLVSNHFHFSNPHRIGYVEKTMVFNDHLVDETVEPIAGYDPSSDHGQVVAQIYLERSNARPLTNRDKRKRPPTYLPKPSL